jgi:lysophospholipase L1-like esterase
MILAIGDSVMQAAGPELYATLPAVVPGAVVDAAPSRQMRVAPAIVAAAMRLGEPPTGIVVHLGTNGLFSDDDFDDLVAQARLAPILVMTVSAPRQWVPTVNARLIAGAQRWPDAVTILDWHRLCRATPGLLGRDEFHLTREGAWVYANAIADALGA